MSESTEEDSCQDTYDVVLHDFLIVPAPKPHEARKNEPYRATQPNLQLTLQPQARTKPTEDVMVDIRSIPRNKRTWERDGEDVTDYFNYGFTPRTWEAYYNKQKEFRSASHKPERPVTHSSTTIVLVNGNQRT